MLLNCEHTRSGREYARKISGMTQFKQRLLDDHAELAKRLQRLAKSVDANDPCAELSVAWADFETTLLDHLDTEERSLFPLVAREHRAAIEALRTEHRWIRRAVAELGVCVELQKPRKEMVTNLLDFLRQHGEGEEKSLYEWAERQNKGRPMHGLLAMFARHSFG
jgi:hemerythrin-like domain-containing protein